MQEDNQRYIAVLIVENGTLQSEFLMTKRTIFVIQIVKLGFIGERLVKVKSIKLLPREDVYNLEVEDTHNFAVGSGVIIHNCADKERYALMYISKGLSSYKKPSTMDSNRRFTFDDYWKSHLKAKRAKSQRSPLI